MGFGNIKGKASLPVCGADGPDRKPDPSLVASREDAGEEGGPPLLGNDSFTTPQWISIEPHLFTFSLFLPKFCWKRQKKHENTSRPVTNGAEN